MGIYGDRGGGVWDRFFSRYIMYLVSIIMVVRKVVEKRVFFNRDFMILYGLKWYNIKYLKSEYFKIFFIVIDMLIYLLFKKYFLFKYNDRCNVNWKV